MVMLSALLLAATVAAPGDHDVVPGERIGKIRLGMTADEIHATLGKARGSYPRNDGLVEEVWTGGKNDVQQVRVWLERGAVVQVSATSGAFRTAEGLSTASPFAAIVRLKLKRTGFETRGSGGGFAYYYDDVARGIAWEITGPGYPRGDGEPQFHVLSVHVHARKRPVAMDEDLVEPDADERCTPDAPERCVLD